MASGATGAKQLLTCRDRFRISDGRVLWLFRLGGWKQKRAGGEDEEGLPPHMRLGLTL